MRQTIAAIGGCRCAVRLALTLLLSTGAHTAAAQDDAPDDAGQQPPPITIRPAPLPSPGLVAEPWAVTRAVSFVDDTFAGNGRRKRGFFVESSHMISGAGWLSVGPGYRFSLFDDRLQADGSAALSWHLYKMVQGRIEAPTVADRLAIGGQAMWQDQTQINYYGIGTDSAEEARSQYRMRHTDIVGYAALRPREWLTIRGEVGWLTQLSVSSPAGTFKPDLPSAIDAHPEDPGLAAGAQPDYRHAEASLTVDTRDSSSHVTRGHIYRAAFTTFSDVAAAAFGFRQYELEGAQFVPFRDGAWVLAARGWLVMTDTPAGQTIPAYLLPSLGGHNTLRSYPSYRFHDRHLAVVNLEARAAVFAHVDAALFVDAGNVAQSMGALNLQRTSYGAGVRLHTGRTTLARLDVAHGGEGWRFVVRTSEPFSLNRVKRTIALVPFFP